MVVRRQITSSMPGMWGRGDELHAHMLEGGKRLVKLWFLPALDATEAPLAAE